MLNRKTTYIYKGREFEICTTVTNEGKKYWVGVNHKYLTNGVTNRPLSLANMYATSSMDETIKRINRDVDIEEYMAKGFDWADAWVKANKDLVKLSGKSQKQYANELRKALG